MGEIKAFYPFKLVMGILISRMERKPELIEKLKGRFGGIDYESGDFPFSFTDYYDGEMGGSIRRFFVSFSDLVNPESLADIKIETNGIEEIFSDGGMRRVNLDPGILSLSRFILATTKDNVHRIPLHKGIYAEVTLIYERHAFQDLPWTYADFRSEANKAALEHIRSLYKDQIRTLKKNSD